MIFKRMLFSSGSLLLVVMLSGCPGADENTSQAGLKVHLAEVHAETKPGGTPLDASGISSSPSVSGGYAQEAIEHHAIRDKNGRLLSMYRAYLVLNNLELQPCPSISQLPREILDSLIGKAHAHAGHGSEPVGGRSLDKPNVIDIITQDEFILPLGDMAVAPATYCGARLSLVRLASEGYGKPLYAAASIDDPTTQPEVPEMAGRMFALRADYCAATDSNGLCTQRVKVDLDDTGLSEPATITIDFDQPLVINSTLREGYVAIGIAYGEWVQDVDITQLVTDATEKQKFLNNLAGSVHIYSRGWGTLPPNL